MGFHGKARQAKLKRRQARPKRLHLEERGSGSIIDQSPRPPPEEITAAEPSGFGLHIVQRQIYLPIEE